MSDVEKCYYAMQAKLGGTLTWHQLNPMQQMQFVQACNILISVASSRNAEHPEYSQGD